MPARLVLDGDVGDPRTMLRITDRSRPDAVTLVLEGRLAGPWVDELTRCWAGLLATHDPTAIRVQLDAVTFVDAAGRALLRAMHERGTVLEASGGMNRLLLDEITDRRP